VPEWLKGAVLKTARRREASRGFESHPRRLFQPSGRDKVVTRLTVYGTHERDLPGVPRTGNKLEMTATAIHRIADGQLVEHWSNTDELGLLQQLGVIPTAEEGAA
jgi:predicted ester cyclase